MQGFMRAINLTRAHNSSKKCGVSVARWSWRNGNLVAAAQRGELRRVPGGNDNFIGRAAAGINGADLGKRLVKPGQSLLQVQPFGQPLHETVDFLQSNGFFKVIAAATDVKQHGTGVGPSGIELHSVGERCEQVQAGEKCAFVRVKDCLLYTSPSPRD